MTILIASGLQTKETVASRDRRYNWISRARELVYERRRVIKDDKEERSTGSVRSKYKGNSKATADHTKACLEGFEDTRGINIVAFSGL